MTDAVNSAEIVTIGGADCYLNVKHVILQVVQGWA